VEVEIGGKTYTLTDNPSHGAVKRARREYKRMLYSQLDLDELREEMSEQELRNTEFEELLQRQLLKHPEQFALMQEDLKEYEDNATIMLAAGLTEQEIEALGEKEYRELLEKCREVLGGGASVFFKD
jgi:hypothetical protein